jgi:hypothetical protein
MPAHASTAIEGLLTGTFNTAWLCWQTEMSLAAYLRGKRKVGQARKGWNSPVARISELDELRVRDTRPVFEPPDPYADEPKIAAWKVSLVVILSCAAFWTGVGYIAMQLLG